VLVDTPASNLIPSRASLDFNVLNSSTVAQVSSANYTLANWKSSFGQDANSINSNPNFVSSSDLHLQSSSPARALGRDYLDLNNNGSTSDPIPAGAYVRGDEIIGVTTAAGAGLPRAPTGLRILVP
jgi:hypothetical protein